MKTRLITLTVAICLGMFAARSFGIWPFNGVVAVITNTGSTNYESCVVAVTGRSYPLGALTAGDTLIAEVSPTGESHIELKLAEQDGTKHHLVVDCYFERQGYSGTVTVDIADGQVRNIARNIWFGFP